MVIMFTETLRVNELSPLLTLQLSVPSSNTAASSGSPKPIESTVSRNTSNTTISVSTIMKDSHFTYPKTWFFFHVCFKITIEFFF